MKKVKEYFNEIRECEELERRSSKKWAEIGTVEETVKMVKYRERKLRNNRRNVLVAITGYGIGAGIALYHNRKKQVVMKSKDNKNYSFEQETHEAKINEIRDEHEEKMNEIRDEHEMEMQKIKENREKFMKEHKERMMKMTYKEKF